MKPRPYDVGYGKPPRHSQFKKGRSGNKKGRPRQRLSLRDELLKAVDKTVALPDGTKITKFQAGMMRLRHSAVQGDLAASWLLELIEETITADPAATPVKVYISEMDARI